MPALTMLETGNWIQPYIEGLPYCNKPPGINWLVALSFATTGQHSALAARLPSVLFILAFVAQIIWTRSAWLDLPSRCIAAVIFLTPFLVIDNGRLIEIDAFYTCLAGMAILYWLQIYSRKGSDWYLWLIPAIILSYAVLTKGPIILLPFYCITITVLAYAKDLKKLISLPHLLAILLILFIPLG